MKNLLKQRLLAGEPAYGTIMTLASTEMCELWCTLGVDFLWVDLEHSPLSLESAQTMMQVMAFSGVTPVVRVPWNEPVMVKRALDIGAHGIVFPMVSTAEQAAQAVHYAKYPPAGMRGVGAARAQRLGLDGQQYRAEANAETMVIVQCETAEALPNLAEIVAVPGVDVLFVGPFDLSMSLGIGGQFDHPDFLAALDKILAVCAEAKMPAGILARGAEDVPVRVAQGFRFLAMTVDAVLYAQAAQDFVQQACRCSL